MDVRAALRRYATPRPFVVSAADGTGARLRVEAEMRTRGWRPAVSPGESGFLVVCGDPGPELGRAIDTVWRAMPPPRRRVSSLDERGEASVEEPPVLGEVGMADRADDRDGLRLDVLHVPLGPVLPDWPAGVRLDVALQGDVVQEAAVTVVESAPPFWRGDQGAARRLDAVARLLRVAGWEAAAERAAVLRDAALAGEDGLAARFAGFRRRVAGSWTLRWMTRDVGVLQGRDVHARLEGWLREIGDVLGGEPAGGPAMSVDVLPELVVGEELGRARLIVASVDVDG